MPGANSGTTMGPDVPAFPAWRWDAVAGSVMPETLIVKQTVPLLALSLMVAVPLPWGSPGGTSFLPFSVAERVTVPAAAPELPTGRSACYTQLCQNTSDHVICTFCS